MVLLGIFFYYFYGLLYQYLVYVYFGYFLLDYTANFWIILRWDDAARRTPKSQGQESTKLRVHQHVAPFFLLQKTNKENTQTCTPTINLPFLHVSEESCWFRRGDRQSRQLEFNVNSWPRSAKHVASRTQASAVKQQTGKTSWSNLDQPNCWGPSFFFSLGFPTCFPFDMWVCLCFPLLSIAELGGAGQSSPVAITHLLLLCCVVIHSRHPHCCRAVSTSKSVIQSWPGRTCSFQPPALSFFSSWTGKMFWFPAYSVYV